LIKRATSDKRQLCPMNSEPTSKQKSLLFSRNLENEFYQRASFFFTVAGSSNWQRLVILKDRYPIIKEKLKGTFYESRIIADKVNEMVIIKNSFDKDIFKNKIMNAL
jgi:hypothetical protein